VPQVVRGPDNQGVSAMRWAIVTTMDIGRRYGGLGDDMGSAVSGQNC